LAKTYRAIQQWDQWLSHFPGQSVLDAEKNFLPSTLAQYYGCQALLIGSPQQQVLLTSTVIPNQLLLSPLLSHNHKTELRSVECGLHELPIASGSIDLVMVPHILEYIDNPRQTLAEACRIVKPQGHIIIFGFNPISLWGLKKLYTKQTTPPWSGNFLAAAQVTQWLNLADFELVEHKTFFFRPPVNSVRLHHRLRFMEWLGRKIGAPLGGIYILIAQAKVTPLTPIKLSWKQKLSDVRMPVIGVPRPTIRAPLP
jgi:SAM-dependent methyltransferase